MNSIQLEYFLAVARTGGFTPAAKRLFISQPALSKQIRLLENELGAILFLRRPHGVVMTPEGKKLLARADEISRIMKEIPGEIKDLQHNVSGDLNIVCGNFLSRRVMPDLLKRLMARYPDICPRIRELGYREQREMLLTGSADVGIGSIPDSDGRLCGHEIFHSDLVLIRSACSCRGGAAKLTKAEIAASRLISYPQGSVMYEAVRRCLAPYTPNIFMDSLSSLTIIELVREDFGLALVPDYLIEPDRRNGIVIGGFDSGEGVTISYYYSPERVPTPQTRAFIEVIREKFALSDP